MLKTLFFHVDESPTASKKKNKTTEETPHGNTHKKSHAERHGTSSIEKKAPKTKTIGCHQAISAIFPVRFPIHENPLFATAPVPACKYAILISPEMTICHFESYATNYPPARGPSRLFLAWIPGGRNAHGGHAGRCSRRDCCAASRTSGLP